MQRKIAIKRLTASDLTFFEYHYRNTTGAKQKAFNLDKAVFINEFYPNLPAHTPNSSVRVSLSIRGHGKATAQALVRKILKQEKNWRLNGELIYDPPENYGRYSLLQKSDFAIIEFLGGSAPNMLTVHRGKDTGPELLLRKALWHLGLRYRLQVPLPGKPDIAFPGKRLAVFVDGCFWHGCPLHATRPKRNQAFWDRKLTENMQRDKRTTAALKASGWTVLRVWEHEVATDTNAVAERMRACLDRPTAEMGVTTALGQ